MIGSTISHYTILDTLGKGGMGVVYKALDTTLQREVCIKVLPPESTSDQRRQKRLKAEAQAASALNHPNICTIHAIDEERGMLFIVMEYIPGHTLREKLANGPVPVSDVLDYAIQTSDALEKAHRLGIVHRDIKPTNIMVTDEGLVKVLDFGLARILRDHSGESLSSASTKENLTGSGEVPGTLNYMSPEQLRGEEVDGRTDQFSLGIVLYELLTGTSPFPGKNPIDVASSILKEEVQPLRNTNSEIPESLDLAVQRLLSKNPEDRYVSLGEFKSELKLLRGDPSTGSRPQQFVSLRQHRYVAAALLFGLMLLVFAALQYGSREETPTISTQNRAAENSIVILPFKNKSGEEKFDRLRLPLTQMAINQLFLSRDLKVMPYERIYQISGLVSELDSDVYDTKLLRKVGTLGRAQMLIQPILFKLGDVWQIQLEFKNSSSGETVATRTVVRQGSANSDNVLFTMLSDMNSEIKDQLGLKSAAGAQQADQAVVIGDSDAMVLYNEGINQLYQGRNLDAVAILSRAVEKDPSFPMAHAYLAIALKNLGFDRRAEESARTAVQTASDKNLSQLEQLYVDAVLAEVTFNYTEAIKAYEQMISLKPDQPEHYLRLGELFERSSEYSKAQQAYKKAITLDSSLAPAFLRSGSVSMQMENNPRAMESFQQALRVYSDLGNSEGKAAVLLALGNLYLNANEYNKAENYFKQSLELNRAINNRSGEGTSLAMIADTYLAAGSAKDSEPFLNDASAIFEEIGDRYSSAKVLIKYGNRFVHSGEYAKAHSYFLQASEIADEIHSLSLQAETADRLSLAYYYLRDYSKAKDFARIALNSFQKIGQQSGLFQSYLSVGDIHYETGDYSAAAEYYEKSLQLARQLNNKKFLAWSLGSMGTIHYLQGRFEDGLRLRLQELKLCNELQDRACIAYSSLNIAHLKSAIGMYEDALTGYDKAIQYFKNEQNSGQIILCLIDKARVYMEHNTPGDYEIAEQVLNEAKQYPFNGDQDASSLIAINQILIKVHKGENEAPALSELAQVNDSAFQRRHYASEFLVSRAKLNLQLKRFHDAIQDANAALKISHELGLKQDQFRAHQIAAFASFSLNDRSLAESELKKASQVLEQMKRNLSETNLRHFESKPEVINFENRMQKFQQDQTL